MERFQPRQRKARRHCLRFSGDWHVTKSHDPCSSFPRPPSIEAIFIATSRSSHSTPFEPSTVPMISPSDRIMEQRASYTCEQTSFSAAYRSRRPNQSDYIFTCSHARVCGLMLDNHEARHGMDVMTRKPGTLSPSQPLVAFLLYLQYLKIPTDGGFQPFPQCLPRRPSRRPMWNVEFNPPSLEHTLSSILSEISSNT